MNGAEYYHLKLIAKPPHNATLCPHESDYNEEQDRPCTFGTSGPYYISDEVYRLMYRIGIMSNKWAIQDNNIRDYDENNNNIKNYNEWNSWNNNYNNCNSNIDLNTINTNISNN